MGWFSSQESFQEETSFLASWSCDPWQLCDTGQSGQETGLLSKVPSRLSLSIVQEALGARFLWSLSFEGPHSYAEQHSWDH